MTTINLVSVHQLADSESILYQLLCERTADMNISHARMPTIREHMQFVSSMPYLAWYLIIVEGVQVGAIYLTRQREVGIFILNAHKGKGYGRSAIAALRLKHQGPILANINPHNARSIKFFEQLGATQLQVTYKLEEIHELKAAESRDQSGDSRAEVHHCTDAVEEPAP